ncbi:MAG: type II secretion system F family protein, partial [Atopostipes sp.]|nr:type II secretion system F family protein [Atopostipes sp.]
SMVIIVSAYLFIQRILRQLSPLKQVHFFISWPFVQSYIKLYWTSFIFLEWGQLLKKGISFQQIIKMMSDENSSAVLKETGEVLSKEMKEGKSIKNALMVLPFFEDEALIAISHGEDLGQLGIEMLFYANYCEEELTEKLEKLLVKIQPIIFVFIAIMIIAIYASMILPVYTMMEGI